MENSIHHSATIYNYLKQLNLCRIFPQRVIKHLMFILIAVFSLGYHGKTVDFERYSACYRTTLALFLNDGKWDAPELRTILKSAVLSLLYQEASCSGKPIYCIVDDTIASNTKPASRVVHP